jgi:hypothetical protein
MTLKSTSGASSLISPVCKAGKVSSELFSFLFSPSRDVSRISFCSYVDRG